MTMLFQAHSGLRYLVLLGAVLVLLAAVYGLATGKSLPAARGLMAAFTGVLDVQILLGLGLVLGGIWYGALIGHLVMMSVAAVVAHVASVKARRANDARRADIIRLIGVVVALVCIIGGIMSIGRGIVGTSPPTITSSAP
jgi:hypothetical protein